MERFAIGIDPGTRTGLAIWDTQLRAFIVVDTHNATQARDRILREFPPAEAVIVFEDARQRKYLPREKNLSEYRGKLMGAGSVKRDCELWEEFCLFYGYHYTAVPPRAGLTKWTDEQFKRMTGWHGRTSNHARDAALLVFWK